MKFMTGLNGSSLRYSATVKAKDNLLYWMTISRGPYNIIKEMSICIIYIKCSYSVLLYMILKYLLRIMLIAISPIFIVMIKKYPKYFKIFGPLKNPSNILTII